MFSKKTRKKDNKINDENYIPKAFKKEKKSKSKRKKESIENVDYNKIKKSKKKSKLKRFIIILILIIILLFGITSGIKAFVWKNLANQMLLNENSTIFDKDGKEIAKIGSERKNEKIDFSEIPNNLKNAYVAIEDERYYSHGGIDLKRTGGAILSYVIHFGSSSYGGSTITQQLVKNLTGDSSSQISRKVNEWWRAIILETFLSKDEILGTYLNVIYVGPDIYGVETGAKYYFNKSVKDLSVEECAFLAGINNSPNSYNPFSYETNNNEKINMRTKTVLSKMLELKYIDKDIYDEAIKNVDNGLKFKKGNIKEEENVVFSYHTDSLISEVIDDISKKYNISENFATNYLNMAGLKINSCQDSDIQKQMETEFEKNKYILNSKINNDTSQAAMVIIEPSTGQVIGCIGGLGKKTQSRTLNRATQSIRQTGSSIKPIAVLAPAIDKKIITAATICDDTEQDFENGYHPTDYNKPLGKTTVRRAVESSQNIPFVEIMEKLKSANSIKYLKKMGISTLTDEDNSLVLSLGGLQNGISPLEMAGAYNTISNDGKYIEPTFYSNIKNNSGKIILKSRQLTRRVFSKEVAFILKELLTQPVNGSNGTATYCKISGVDVAAKTGTTDENYDRWLCGFTPYYTAVTWYGFDKNESINFNKKNPAGLLWANVMSRIHTGLKGAQFEKPNKVKAVTICAETGMRAKTGCTDTYIEYFLNGTVPNLCDKHTGTEITTKNSNNLLNDTQNKIDEIINGITTDIDVEDPQQINMEKDNNSNENKVNNSVNNTINTNKNNTNTINNPSSNSTNSNGSNTYNQNSITNQNQTSTNSTINNSNNQSSNVIENTTQNTNTSIGT